MDQKNRKKMMPKSENSPTSLTEQLNKMFQPSAIAVVGVPRSMKMGRLFLTALLDQGYPGTLYPINPKADEIEGLKAYASVSDIPGPVDLAIILVPHHQTLSIIKECADKGVKGAVLFTAGYKETGTEEGVALEKELVRISRASGMRLIGPNCMGLYCPETGLSFFPELSRETGCVGLVSHSGSLANIMGRMGKKHGIGFSKAISLGNECDLDSADFLQYLGSDPNTMVIGTYLEGIKNGNRFLNVLKSVCRKKPVVLWKTGLTAEGAKAAASHTGAMAGSARIWESVVHQGGGTAVVGFDAWVDALTGFSFIPQDIGDRIAIVSGPGGFAVAGAEACEMAGLRMATLSADTKSRLSKFIAATGTSLKNPIDIGLSGAMDPHTMKSVTEIAISDENVDAVLVFGTGMSAEEKKIFAKTFKQLKDNTQKPILLVSMPGFDQDDNTLYFESHLPVFSSIERAMAAYARVLSYQRWIKNFK